MNEHRLFWPEDPKDEEGWMDLALELSIRWNLPFWFNIRLLESTPLEPRRIYITGSIYTTFWTSNYKKLKQTNTYKTYMQNYLGLYSPTSVLNSTYVEGEFLVTNDFLTSIHEAAFRKSKNVTTGSMQELDKVLAVGRNETWTDVLNKYFRQTPPFKRTEKFVLSDSEVLEVIGRLAAKYGSKVMMHQLGWWFVQYYTVMGYDEAFVFKYGDRALAALMKPLFCESQVEALFKHALISDHAESKFPANKRDVVDAIFVNVAAAAIAKIGESAWLDKDAKNTAIMKISGIVVSLWPRTLSPTASNLSSTLPAETSYFRFWVREQQRSASLIGTRRYYDESVRLAHNYRDPAFNYDYVINHLTVAMLALEQPFYVLGGSPAMNYGGLGAGFAQALVKAFDSRGILHLWDGAVKSWLSNDSVAEYLRRAGCHGKGSHDNIFPEIPGLEVVFRALQSESRLSRDSSVNMAGFDSAKMFFVQYCRVICGLSKSSLKQGCNFALRNFEPFAQVFDCAIGSPMNPVEKCSFF
ncbi:unnamed protein product [Ixodes hexagonus]